MSRQRHVSSNPANPSSMSVELLASGTATRSSIVSVRLPVTSPIVSVRLPATTSSPKGSPRKAK
jgi:hypothetical protein